MFLLINYNATALPAPGNPAGTAAAGGLLIPWRSSGRSPQLLEEEFAGWLAGETQSKELFSCSSFLELHVADSGLTGFRYRAMVTTGRPRPPTGVAATRAVSGIALRM
jgi:hypothetical protein